MGIFREIGPHAFQDVNAESIVARILSARERYEARQRAKGVKSDLEAAQKAREMLEEERRKRSAAEQK